MLFFQRAGLQPTRIGTTPGRNTANRVAWTHHLCVLTPERSPTTHLPLEKKPGPGKKAASLEREIPSVPPVQQSPVLTVEALQSLQQQMMATIRDDVVACDLALREEIARGMSMMVLRSDLQPLPLANSTSQRKLRQPCRPEARPFLP